MKNVYNAGVGVCDETTERLVRELQLGGEAEIYFRCLFERYYAQVQLFFRRKGVSPEDAEELTQSVMLSVYKHLDGLREPSQFEGWLFRIAQNTVRNYWEHSQAQKRAARVVELDADRDDAPAWAEILAAPGDGPLDELLEAERLAQLRAAMASLPEQMRRCVQMRIVHEMSVRETAAALGIAANTVKAHLFQARRILASKLLVK